MKRPDTQEEAEKSSALEIILLGNPEVGKSSLVEHFTENGSVQPSYPTTNTQTKEKVIEIDNETIRVKITEAGEKGMEDLTHQTQSPKSSVAALVVFDVTNRKSFDDAWVWITQFTLMNKFDPENSIILVGNKTDLEEKRKVSTEEGAVFAKNYGVEFIETSAKTGEGVEEAFILAAKAISSKQKTSRNNPTFVERVKSEEKKTRIKKSKVEGLFTKINWN